MLSFKQQYFTVGCVNLQQVEPFCFSSTLSILLTIHIAAATTQISWCCILIKSIAVSYCAFKFGFSFLACACRTQRSIFPNNMYNMQFRAISLLVSTNRQNMQNNMQNIHNIRYPFHCAQLHSPLC